MAVDGPIVPLSTQNAEPEAREHRISRSIVALESTPKPCSESTLGPWSNVTTHKETHIKSLNIGRNEGKKQLTI